MRLFSGHHGASVLALSLITSVVDAYGFTGIASISRGSTTYISPFDPWEFVLTWGYNAADVENGDSFQITSEDIWAFPQTSSTEMEIYKRFTVSADDFTVSADDGTEALSCYLYAEAGTTVRVPAAVNCTIENKPDSGSVFGNVTFYATLDPGLRYHVTDASKWTAYASNNTITFGEFTYDVTLSDYALQSLTNYVGGKHVFINYSPDNLCGSANILSGALSVSTLTNNDDTNYKWLEKSGYAYSTKVKNDWNLGKTQDTLAGNWSWNENDDNIVKFTHGVLEAGTDIVMTYFLTMENPDFAISTTFSYTALCEGSSDSITSDTYSRGYEYSVYAATGSAIYSSEELSSSEDSTASTSSQTSTSTEATAAATTTLLSEGFTGISSIVPQAEGQTSAYAAWKITLDWEYDASMVNDSYLLQIESSDIWTFLEVDHNLDESGYKYFNISSTDGDTGLSCYSSSLGGTIAHIPAKLSCALVNKPATGIVSGNITLFAYFNPGLRDDFAAARKWSGGTESTITIGDFTYDLEFDAYDLEALTIYSGANLVLQTYAPRNMCPGKIDSATLNITNVDHSGSNFTTWSATGSSYSTNTTNDWGQATSGSWLVGAWTWTDKSLIYWFENSYDQDILFSFYSKFSSPTDSMEVYYSYVVYCEGSSEPITSSVTDSPFYSNIFAPYGNVVVESSSSTSSSELYSYSSTSLEASTLSSSEISFVSSSSTETVSTTGVPSSAASVSTTVTHTSSSSPASGTSSTANPTLTGYWYGDELIWAVIVPGSIANWTSVYIKGRPTTGNFVFRDESVTVGPDSEDPVIWSDSSDGSVWTTYEESIPSADELVLWLRTTISGSGDYDATFDVYIEIPGQDQTYHKNLQFSVPDSNTATETSTSTSSSTITEPEMTAYYEDGNPVFEILIPGTKGPWISVDIIAQPEGSNLKFSSVSGTVDKTTFNADATYSNGGVAINYDENIETDQLLGFVIKTIASGSAPYASNATVAISYAGTEPSNGLSLPKRLVKRNYVKTYGITYKVPVDGSSDVSASSSGFISGSLTSGFSTSSSDSVSSASLVFSTASGYFNSTTSSSSAATLATGSSSAGLDYKSDTAVTSGVVGSTGATGTVDISGAAIMTSTTSVTSTGGAVDASRVATNAGSDLTSYTTSVGTLIETITSCGTKACHEVVSTKTLTTVVPCSSTSTSAATNVVITPAVESVSATEVDRTDGAGAATGTTYVSDAYAATTDVAATSVTDVAGALVAATDVASATITTRATSGAIYGATSDAAGEYTTVSDESSSVANVATTATSAATTAPTVTTFEGDGSKILISVLGLLAPLLFI